MVTPENVGGSSDVLYSSAGNVREDMYFNYGIFAFGWEVGGSVYNPATGNFQGGSFQPPWVGQADLVSGHSETMEYPTASSRCSGSPRTSAATRPPATSTLTPGARAVRLADRREVRDQRAGHGLLHDGRLGPTLKSPRYKQTEFREPGEELWVDKTTTFKWFSVDAAGNVEPAGYDPENPATANNYRTTRSRSARRAARRHRPGHAQPRARRGRDVPAFMPGVAATTRRRRRPT